MISSWKAVLVIGGVAFGGAAAAQMPQAGSQAPVQRGGPMMAPMSAQMPSGQMMAPGQMMTPGQMPMMNDPEMRRQMQLMSEGCAQMMGQMAQMRTERRR